MQAKEPYKNRIELLQGTLDLLILPTLQWRPRHGYAIAQGIRSGSDEVLQVGTGLLYPALHLEKTGWLRAAWRATENRQRARFYGLTAKGKKQLAAEHPKWLQIVEAIAALMSREPRGEHAFRIGMTQYKSHTAQIRYDSIAKDYVGDLAGVQPADLVPWQQGKFWEWFGIVACAHVAGGVVARKLMPSTSGGDEDDKERFKQLCTRLNFQTPGLGINWGEAWAQAQAVVLEDLENPDVMRAVREQAAVLRCEFGL